jgi:hypothetical protein
MIKYLHPKALLAFHIHQRLSYPYSYSAAHTIQKVGEKKEMLKVRESQLATKKNNAGLAPR